MGGTGSGRVQGNQSVCEEYRRIDLADLDRRDGSTRARIEANGQAVAITYMVQGRTYSERLLLRSTPTMFGGRRRWFVCPGCQRGCRIVFIAPQLRCRRCLGLLYASQRVPPWQSALWHADAVRERIAGRLGQSFEDGDAFPPKPPRMRWRTYRKLQDQYEKVAGRWAAGLCVSLGLKDSPSERLQK